MNNIVTSDLEGTLSAGNTWRILGEFVQAHGRKGEYRRFFYARMPKVLLSKMGWLNGQKMREDWFVDMTRMLAGFNAEKISEVMDFIVDELWQMRRPDVVAELQKHVADGRRVVVVSGTYQMAAERFAARFGAEGIGTPLALDANGLATGKLIGKLNTGEQKVLSIRQKLGVDEVLAAYGDTEGDIPMLSIAQNAVAAYPNKLLAEVAQAKGWRMMKSEE